MNFQESIKLNDYIIWGAGRISEDFYNRYIKQEGHISRPLFWVDRDEAKIGNFIDGVKVISPDEMIKFINEKDNKNISLVIGVAGTAFLSIVKECMLLGFEKIYSAQQLDAIWYSNDYSEDCAFVQKLLYDEKSKNIYSRLWENMKCGRAIDLSLYEANQYFPNDVISHFEAGEVIADAGSCKGEEIDRALNLNSHIEIHSFEPDSRSLETLRAKYNNEKRVHLYEYALWKESANIDFSLSDTPESSRLDTVSTKTSGGGRNAIPLDEMIDKNFTFIKMDIEGVEYEAILGAEQIIRKQKPKLAICIYHNLMDYVRIPKLIYEYNPDYKFYVRQHSIINAETVLYAI